MYTKLRTRLDQALIATGAAVLLAACGGGSEETGGASSPGSEFSASGSGSLRAIVQVTVDHAPSGQSAYAIICEGGVTQLQGGGSIRAGEACDALADPDVRDRLINGVANDRSCEKVEGSVATATGTGTINDVSFEFSLTRTDSCDVADWDGLLSDVLAPAAL